MMNLFQDVQSDCKRAILVAYEPGEVSVELTLLTTSLGYDVETASDGDQAWILLRSRGFDLLVVDAGLPGKPSYDICDSIAEHNMKTKVVLVASVYRKTRYKRNPISLYGADDYVEQHHIHDKLPGKIARLLGNTHSGDPHKTADPEKIRIAGDLRIENPSMIQFDKNRLLRTARILASDMAVYNPNLLKLDFQKFSKQEQKDLEDGADFFSKLVPDLKKPHAETLLLDALAFLKTRETEDGTGNT